MSSETSTGECTAHDKQSKQECECTDYIEATDIPDYCGECYHRRYHHLLSKPGASKKGTAVKSLLADILGRNSDAGGKGKASSSKGGGFKSSLGAVVAASSSKSKSSALSAAHREANQGMRPTSDSSVTNKKGKASDRKTTEPKKKIFKAVSVQVLACGTVVIDGARQLPEDSNKVPDRIQTQTAQLDNLAVVDSQGIVFDCDASHEEIEEQLTDLLPLPFNYFARLKHELGKRPWYLAAAVKGKLVIVPSEDTAGPDGATLDFNKGTGTAGYRNSKIWIVSRDPIPVELLREWAPSSSSYRESQVNDGDLEEDLFSSDTESATNERIPAMNKRRLSSRTSADEEDNSEEEPPKKKKKLSSKKWTRGLDILNDEVAHEIMDSQFIDLTADEARTSRSTPDFLRNPPKSPPPRENPASPGRSEPHYDPTLGNPYDKNISFKF
ncbi:hypothetical protein MVEN_02297100 [Mycena venus]|uniref:Uncharacterized protein n=1 Tax=Mycena venus TaxID=2733690 RepID=A0A8H6X616_9AGAR|nr:hypothetical protein MVEN_02297100 [Mycena venus]